MDPNQANTGLTLLCVSCSIPLAFGALVGWLLRGRKEHIGRFWFLPAFIRKLLLEEN
jgi:hypothetical protein